jgi:hypothetical protein
MKKFVFNGLCLFISAHCLAQKDTSGIIPVIDAQTTSIQQSSNILNGRSHIAYPSTIQGSGYFVDGWSTGSVVYEDVEYRGVKLKYDQYKDELIILHPNGLPVILFSPRVNSFSLLSRRFININPLGLAVTGSESGFFELLSEGSINLLVKRKKILDEVVQTSGVTKSFVSRNEFLAVKGGKIYKIKKESNLFDLMPEKKQGAKNLLRQNNINFNTDPQSALLLIAEYFNQSSN